MRGPRDPVIGVPVTASRLFKLCCASCEQTLDPEQLSAAQPEEWRQEKTNGATPLHALCANTTLTLEAFRAAVKGVPPDVWGKCTVLGANPLHRLLGNEQLTIQMLELVAGKVPPEAWYKLNQACTPAHRLCSNSAAVTAQMLRLAGRHAPPQTWKTKNLPGPRGNGGGLTPIDLVLSRRMTAARTPELLREAAALMDGQGGGKEEGSVRRPIRSLSGGSVSGGSSPRSIGSSNSTGPIADWKFEAAKHFFALGSSGGVGLSTGLAAPIIKRQPGDVACVRLRGWVDGNTRGACMNGCTKGTVFAEAKFTVATVLDKFKEARRSVKDSSGKWQLSGFLA